MLKTLGAQVKEFKKDSILTPVFMILEVIMETIIPLIMGSIISGGVQKGNLRHIYKHIHINCTFFVHLQNK